MPELRQLEFGQNDEGSMSRFVIESGRNKLTINAHSNHKGCLMMEVAGGGLSILLDAEQCTALSDALLDCACEILRTKG